MTSPAKFYGNDSSILITGASSGVGAALAVRLARHGGRLALTARRKDRLEEVGEQVRRAGGRPLLLEGDVRDLPRTRELAAQISAEQGPVEVAFLNAGLGGPTSLTRFSADKVRYMFEVNVFGVVNWLEPLLPDMISRGKGVLAVTSSLASVRGIPTGGAYSATKAAVSTLMESLRADARGRGLQVSIIEPGFFKSELTEKNKFPMPFLLETEEAARIIEQEVAEGNERIRFPWQLSGVMSALRYLPDPVFDLMHSVAAKSRK